MINWLSVISGAYAIMKETIDDHALIWKKKTFTLTFVGTLTYFWPLDTSAQTLMIW